MQQRHEPLKSMEKLGKKLPTAYHKVHTESDTA
ncbi:Uncharacterised protein [Neisseria animalis]|nr:Uncharacterised protein [Neisseria animalis]